MNLLSCRDKYTIRLDSPRYCLEIHNYQKKRQKQYSVYGLCILSGGRRWQMGTMDKEQIIPLVKNWIGTWHTELRQMGWINFPYNYQLILSRAELDSFIEKMLTLFVRQYGPPTDL